MPFPTPGVPIPGAVSMPYKDKLRQRLSAQDTGMVPDCIQGIRGDMTAGGSTLAIKDAFRGTVNTFGNAVTRTNGDSFPVGSVFNAIIINGVGYLISDYVDDTHATLTTSAGTQTGVAYSVPNSGININPNTGLVDTTYYVGKHIAVFGAGDACYVDAGNTLCCGAVLLTTIASVAADGTSLTTAANAVNAVTDSEWNAGTDNRPAFSNLIQSLRNAGGGILNIDAPGNYGFYSYGYTNLFGWHFIDSIDFDNCHIIQGEHTKFVIGSPNLFLSINDDVFYKWTLLDPLHPLVTNLTAPVPNGSLLLNCNPAQMVRNGQPLYNRGDWILIFTGYVLDSWTGFAVPDAQICQIVFADTSTGLVILAEPTLKPFAQENYPSPVGWTGPSGPAPFGIINVTDLIIHDCRYKNLNLDSFFFSQLIYGGQVDGFYLEGVRGNLRGGFHAMNYVHNGKTSEVRVFIDNLASPYLPFDYAWTVAVGSSNVLLSKAEINSTGVVFLHVHEGAANCGVEFLRLGSFNGTPQALAHNEAGGAISSGSNSLTVTSGGFVPSDVNKTLQVAGTYTAVVASYVSAGHVTVFPPAPSTFSGAAVAVGFSIQAVHVAGRSYGLKISNCSFIGFDPNAVIRIEADCIAGGLISDIEINGRAASTYPFDIECFGAGWRIDCPQISALRIYQLSTNITPFVTRATDPMLGGIEGVRGLLSPIGGLGIKGNILRFSENLSVIPWVAASGVAVTPNTTDIADPVGTHTASKVVTGATSVNLGVFYDAFTPAPGSVTGTGNNANRSFILSFYVYSPIENQIDVLLASFVHLVGPDAANTATARFGVYAGWQRIDITLNCNSGASTGTELLTGLAVSGALSLVGLSSTFYFWGITLQEVSGLRPLCTRAIGTAVRYQIGLHNPTGQVSIGPIVDDGVSPVQMVGPVNIQGNLIVPTADLDGINFTGFRTPSVGAHWNGSAWIADAAVATLFQILPTQVIIYMDSGLTIGSSFTPTARFEVFPTGVVLPVGVPLTLGTPLAPLSGGSGTAASLSGILRGNGSSPFSAIAIPSDATKFLDGTGAFSVPPSFTLPVIDTTALVKGSSDASKQVRIEADGLTTGTTRVIVMPDEDITLASNTELVGDGTTSISCSASYSDVPGLSFTLNKNGTWKITCILDINFDSSALGIFAQVVIGGSAQSRLLRAAIGGSAGTVTHAGTYSQVWTYPNVGSTLVKIQAKAAFALGARDAGGTNSVLLAEFLHP